MNRWLGAIEGMERGLLYGWCIDGEQPDARVVLEICLNGEATGSVIADVARTDLAATFAKASARPVADCCHGFVFDTELKKRTFSGTLTVRVANTQALLEGAITSGAVRLPAASANNYVFSDGGLRLHGWVKANGAQPATVRAYLGNREVGAAVANVAHPTLRPFDIGAQGFVLDLPPELADGEVHSIRVVDAQGAALNGSPVTLCCHSQGGRALLPAGGDSVVANLLDSYERYMPRSLGMAYYPQWSREFDLPAKVRKPRASVGLIITQASDAAALKRTQASLAQQEGVDLTVFAPSAKGRGAKNFESLLRQACDSGCDVIGCVRAGDTLPLGALAHGVEGFQAPQVQVVYTDSEFQGRPWFKPAWNPEYALSSDYPLELMLSRVDLVKRRLAAYAGPTDSAALSWELLAAASTFGNQAIVHVPRVLYIWGSAPGAAEKEARTAAAASALAHLDPASSLVPHPEPSPEPLFQPRRLVRHLSRSERKTAVTIIVPTRDRLDLLERCLDTVRRHTRWPALEIIVVDNDSAEAKTKSYLRAIQKQGIKVLRYPGAFNFADMNNRAVESATGTIVGLLNNDIEALEEGWLDEIVSQLLRPGVGAVGAKLVWPNGMVQHGGVLLGVGNAAGHFGNRLAETDWGDHGRNQLLQQVSGVTAACLFLRKSDYLAVGGMDGTAFPVTFNDVDLCLKLIQQGKAVVWTPYARLLHAESASRGKEETPQQKARAQRELDNLRQRWGHVLLQDPAYHPSLNLDAHSHAFGGLALPPRDRAPRFAGLAA